MERVGPSINTILIFALLVLLLLGMATGYEAVLSELVKNWDSGDNSYCYLVLPVFLYLCWEVRARPTTGEASNHLTSGFHFESFEWNPWGLLIGSVFVAVMFVGEFGSIITLVYLGIWGLLVSILFLLYGWRLRHLSFQLFILLFLVPLPPFIHRMLTFQLKLAASALAEQMFRLFDISVLRTGNIIDIGVTQLQVVDACSGLRYFMPMILMSLLIGYFGCTGWWRRGLLVLLVIPLTIFFNAVRIFCTGWLFVNGYDHLAESFFHDLAGWLTFMLAAAALYMIARGLRRVGPVPQNTEIQDKPSSSLPLGRAILCTMMFCLFFVGSGRALEKLPESLNIPERSSFETFPMHVGPWHGERLYLADEVIDSLWSDDYVQARYRHEESEGIIHLLIPYYRYQKTRHTAHAPQSCMLGSGWSMIQTGKRTVPTAGDKDLNMVMTLWRRGEQRVLGAFFFLQRGRIITDPWMNKFFLFWDAVTQRRTDGALVRIEMNLSHGQTMEEGLQHLDEFTRHLWPVLGRFVPN